MNDITTATDAALLDSFAAHPAARVRAEILRRMAAFQRAYSPPLDNYRCGECGASGVRLYRKYQTVLEAQHLYCRGCALLSQGKAEPDSPSEHSIGWLVAAVPTEDGKTYWGYSSVPQAGVEWWNQLQR